jgi:hypothetical protein
VFAVLSPRLDVMNVYFDMTTSVDGTAMTGFEEDLSAKFSRNCWSVRAAHRF